MKEIKLTQRGKQWICNLQLAKDLGTSKRSKPSLGSDFFKAQELAKEIKLLAENQEEPTSLKAKEIFYKGYKKLEPVVSPTDFNLPDNLKPVSSDELNKIAGEYEEEIDDLNRVIASLRTELQIVNNRNDELEEFEHLYKTWRKEVDQAAIVRQGKMPLLTSAYQACLDHYEKTAKPDVKNGSKENGNRKAYKSVVGLFIKWLNKDIKINDITDNLIKEYLDTRLEVSKSNYNKHRRYISGFMSFCEAEYRLPNPFNPKVIKKQQVARTGAKAYDFKKMVDHFLTIDEEYWQTAFGLMLYTGMRENELCGIRLHKDVTIEGSDVVIRLESHEERSLKNETNRPRINMLSDEVKDYVIRRYQIALAQGHDYLFQASKACRYKVWSTRSFNDNIKRFLPFSVLCENLRSTFISEFSKHMTYDEMQDYAGVDKETMKKYYIDPEKNKRKPKRGE